MTEREFAISVVKRLQEAGHEALFAGGCVRDELLGMAPQDYDVATSALPDQVQKLFRRTFAVGASFGVIEVVGPSTDDGYVKTQVATFRTDVSYSDGRRPDQVVFTTAYEDAQRRDFTINGMFYDPIQERLLDYVGGQADLEAKILRAIGEPRLRFTEDKLRMLRAARLATRFGLMLDPATADAIRAMAPQIGAVSAERIAEELRQLLVHPRRAQGVNLMFELGLVHALFPELVPMKGLPQGLPSAPAGDLWTHVLSVLERLSPDVSFTLAMAALLHDVGKPRTIARLGDRYTFYHHEHVGAEMSVRISDRLKLSNAERDRIAWLVDKHQFLCDVKSMRTSKLKTTLAHPGIRELLALHRADALAWGRSTEHVEYCEGLLAEWSTEELNPPPFLTGHDLIRRGYRPGPAFKRILDAVREAQLDGAIKSTSQAWEIAERMKESEAGEQRDRQ
jgi:poly(A) polymerase